MSFGRYGPACADSVSESMSMKAVSMHFCTILHCMIDFSNFIIGSCFLNESFNDFLKIF